MKYYSQLTTPVGEVILAGDRERLSHIHLMAGTGSPRFAIPADWISAPQFFGEAEKQLHQYFQKKRRVFELPLDLQGTDFQKMVWQALQEIPYGGVVTYSDIARKIGRNKAARAVGLANARNPLPIIIPCHRVIGADGSLTGFAYGLQMKETLLQLEKKPGSAAADLGAGIPHRLV